MALSLTTRAGKGTPLTALEMDTNLTNIQTEVNDVLSRLIVSVNLDGTLKPGSIVLSGPTSSRPSTPPANTFYFDTDISVLLIYRGASWITASGSPGDIKTVNAASEAVALTKNPGWVAGSHPGGTVFQLIKS